MVGSSSTREKVDEKLLGLVLVFVSRALVTVLEMKCIMNYVWISGLPLVWNLHYSFPCFVYPISKYFLAYGLPKIGLLGATQHFFLVLVWHL